MAAVLVADYFFFSVLNETPSRFANALRLALQDAPPQ
jgi:hypothetical protein